MVIVKIKWLYTIRKMERYWIYYVYIELEGKKALIL